ncbi:MAG: efflux transporter protein [Hyphomicrobiales bacterium]|nr:efflux transporter protein [Hyphomicrobiales bacterium]
MRRQSIGFVVASLLLFLCTISAAPARAADPFEGKTINIIVGYSSGGGYDVYSRVIARHISQHIPGKPNVVVQNMPGAGSAKAAAYIFSAAPKDGTAIGSVSPGVIIGPLLDPKSDQRYEPTKLVYIGTADSGTRVCATLKRSKISTFEDAQKHKTIIGGVAPGSSTTDYAWLHKRTSGANFEVVSGYPGSAEITLAMERGEVDGICGMDWSSLKSQHPEWLRDDRMNVIVQAGLKPNPELTRLGVPEIWQFTEGENNRKAVELIVAQQVFGRPFILPPGTPELQVGILRKAFDLTMRDPQFLADAAKLGLAVEPADGETVQAAVAKIYASSPEVVAKARAAIEP